MRSQAEPGNEASEKLGRKSFTALRVGAGQLGLDLSYSAGDELSSEKAAMDKKCRKSLCNWHRAPRRQSFAHLRLGIVEQLNVALIHELPVAGLSGDLVQDAAD